MAAEVDTNIKVANKDSNDQGTNVHHERAVEYVNHLDKNATKSGTPHQGQPDTQSVGAHPTGSTGLATAERTATTGLSSNGEGRGDVNTGVLNAGIGSDTCTIHLRDVTDAALVTRSETETFGGPRAIGDIGQNFPVLTEDARSKQMLQLLEWLISPPSGDPPCKSSAHVMISSRPSHCGFRNDILDSLRGRMQNMIAAAASKQVEKAVSTKTGDLDQQKRDWALMEGTWREQARCASIGVGKRWGTLVNRVCMVACRFEGRAIHIHIYTETDTQ